jgi:MFS family permease
VRPGPARRRGGLLWHRDFRLLWTGETISGAGTAMAAAGVPLLAVTVLYASTTAVAVLTAAAYLPWLVIGLPAGAWADRLPVRPLMITCDLVSALLYASLPAAAWLGVLTPPPGRRGRAAGRGRECLVRHHRSRSSMSHSR